MRATTLTLTDFRNHRETRIEFAPGINLLLGANGQGKTNLVEALIFLAYGRSHRLSQPSGLIYRDAQEASIVAHFAHQTRQIKTDCQLSRSLRTRTRVNGNPVRLRDLAQYVHLVVFAPEDLSLIRDEPEVRRDFVDRAIEFLSPRMISIFSDYDRVLKQRNSLLKSLRQLPGPQRDNSTLTLWDEKLCTLGAHITLAREKFITSLATPVADAYYAIAGRTSSVELMIDTRGREKTTGEIPSVEDLQNELQAKLDSALSNDIEKGVTSVGPHRDDLLMRLNGLPVKGYASHGESWTFALALKLGLAQLLRTDPLGDPIIVLDDVFAELDESRRQGLARGIASFEQVLITAAVRDDVPEGDIATTWFVADGSCEMLTSS